MFTVTLTLNLTALVVSVLVLIALRINTDRSVSPEWLRKAVQTNMAGLITILVSYTMCACALSFDPKGAGGVLYRTGFTLRDLSDFMAIPIVIIVVSYLGAIAREKPRIAEKVVAIGRMLLVIGSLLGAMMGGFILYRLCGFENVLLETIVYGIEFVMAIIALLLTAAAILISWPLLDLKKRVCFLLFLVSQELGVFVVRHTMQSVLFAVNTGLLLFLFLTMQAERVSMSTVASVRAALDDTARLNDRLEASLKDLHHESALLKNVSGIYTSLHIIDLNTGCARELVGVPEDFRHFIDRHDVPNEKTDVRSWLCGDIAKVCSAPFRAQAEAFADLETLNARMYGQKSIAFEAKIVDGKWYRFTFIRIGNDANAPLCEVALASENIDREKREKEALVHATVYDELSGVFNRNAYTSRLKAFGGVALPDDLWVMVTDVNGLKRVNDERGHEAGDAMILATADCLKTAVGSAGSVYRCGGDEFVSIVRAKPEAFRAITDRLEAERLKHLDRLGFELVFSIGCVCAGDLDDPNISALVAEADRQMYENKKRYYQTHPTQDRRI